ncbi:MAG: HAD family phosphatase [Lachnospiraceae bacterium]|nr:HAD family phosphatase [Lachnospiraceae bacterium]
MIKNIIFDIGNVLTDFRWREFLLDKGFSEEMVERIAQVSVKHPLWKEFDRGTWEDEVLMQKFVEEAPELKQELYAAYSNVEGIVTPRDYAIPWIKELKAKGLKVWYLSNFARKIEIECREALRFLPYMDGGILSYKEKLIKPEPAIYELMLKRYGLVAQESVFIDDLPENVKAAKAFGIHGICFVSKEQVEEELFKLGV